MDTKDIFKIVYLIANEGSKSCISIYSIIEKTEIIGIFKDNDELTTFLRCYLIQLSDSHREKVIQQLINKHYWNGSRIHSAEWCRCGNQIVIKEFDNKKIRTLDCSNPYFDDDKSETY